MKVQSNLKASLALGNRLSQNELAVRKDRTSPLDEIIQRINEEFYGGEFTDADRVMVDTLYQKCAKF